MGPTSMAVARSATGGPRDEVTENRRSSTVIELGAPTEMPGHGARFAPRRRPKEPRRATPSPLIGASVRTSERSCERFVCGASGKSFELWWPRRFAGIRDGSRRRAGATRVSDHGEGDRTGGPSRALAP